MSVNNASCVMMNYSAEAGLPRRSRPSPDMRSVWISGILAIAIISALSLLGLAFRPFIKRPWYKKFLLVLMATSVGILSSTSLLFLLPSAIELDMSNESIRMPYVKKICVVFATLLAFFNFEIIFKRAVKWRSEVKHRKHLNNKASQVKLLSSQKPSGAEISDTSLTIFEFEDDSVAMGCRPRIPDTVIEEERLSVAASLHNLAETSLAWVLLAGDSVHSYVDGMAIGVAMTRSLVEGLGVALVILIEELPHKLGDIAVLLNSGLSLKRSVLYCFLASVPAFAGFSSGVLVGEFIAAAAPWVFAIATALFLYVAFVDILPEVIEKIDAETEPSEHAAKAGGENFFQMFISLRRLPLADIGMVIGFITAAVICAYAENIDWSAIGL